MDELLGNPGTIYTVCGQIGYKKQRLGAMYSLTVEKFKVAICVLLEKRAYYTVSVMNLLALSSKFTLHCLLCHNGQDSVSILLYIEHNVKFLSVEGAGGTSQGKRGFSRFLCAAFCFFLLLLHGPSVMHMCGASRGAQTMESFSDLAASAWAQ